VKSPPNGHGDGSSDGHGAFVPPSGPPASPVAPAPAKVAELAEACRRFVKTAVGVELDYEPETLSLLDHYVEQARASVVQRPEAIGVVAHAVGAYFGEVVRRRYASWWQIEGDDPAYWQIQLQSVYLAFSPVAIAYEALARTEHEPHEDEGAPMSQLELEEEDQSALAERLAELPPVSEAEFFAPSTRLEVIDIAVDAIRSRRLGAGEPDAHLSPEDYEGFPIV
jgi:hypothetical protein